jgi:Protein of unknown function (DUF3631)
MSELTNLDAHLCQAENYLRRYVVLTKDQSVAVVLWAAHTHAFAAAVATAYLWITSAEMESGKTRLLEVLRPMVANPWFTGRTTAAALTRKVDKAKPTLLLDEYDAIKNGDKEFAETLRGVLNSGYREGGTVTVCVGQGANLGVREFSTYCPKAIAGIGDLPDTVRSRAIPIILKRRLARERIERFRQRRDEPLLKQIGLSLEAEVENLIDDLASAEPDLPDGLSDRQEDVWEPLLAIADAAGGDWPVRAREAAVRLSARGEPDEETLSARLLADIREVFGDSDRLRSADLLKGLHEIEEAPWGDWYGKPFSARKLADMLRRYEIRPHPVRFGSEVAKGYERADFEDALDRYVPVPPNSSGYIGYNGSSKPETAPSPSVTEDRCNRSENPEKPLEQADVTDVTDSGRGSGRMEAEAFDEWAREGHDLGVEVDDDEVGR